MASGSHDKGSKQSLRQVYARLRQEYTAADLQKHAEEDNWIPADQWIAELQALHDKLVKGETFEEGSSHGDPKKQQQTKTKGWRGFAGGLRSVPQGLHRRRFAQVRGDRGGFSPGQADRGAGSDSQASHSQEEVTNMASSPNGGQLFTVHYSGAVGKALRRIQRQASEEGRGEEFLHALRTIRQHLTHDPLQFGEPLYRLPSMRLQVQCGSVRPLVVDYAVYQDRAQVFIKGFRLLPASGP
jgi:hypothetical protein